METRVIRFRPQCRGKAPRRYGKNAYTFPMGDSEILKCNGWTLLGGGLKGNYFSPPAGQNGEEVIVDAVVPTSTEIERMAMQWHQEGKPILEQIEGWMVTYVPGPTPGSLGWSGAPTWFEFGLNASWGVRLSWHEGDDKPPRYVHRYDCEIRETTEIEGSDSAEHGETGE